MTRQIGTTLKWMCVATIVLAVVMNGCSNPLKDDDDTPPESADAGPTATGAPTIPIITPTPIDPTTVAAASPTPNSEERPETYIVADGDNLYGIAARFDVELSRLVEENGLSDPNDIWIGQELIIPPLE